MIRSIYNKIKFSFMSIEKLIDKADSLSYSGNFYDAIKYYSIGIDRVTKTSFYYPILFHNRGIAKDELARWTRKKELLKSAINDFDIAINTQPENASAYICRGLTYYHLVDFIYIETDSLDIDYLHKAERDFFLAKTLDNSMKDYDFYIGMIENLIKSYKFRKTNKNL